MSPPKAQAAFKPDRSSLFFYGDNPYRTVEAVRCATGFIRLDVWVRDPFGPIRRQWVVLSEAEWRALRRRSPSRKVRA